MYCCGIIVFSCAIYSYHILAIITSVILLVAAVVSDKDYESREVDIFKEDPEPIKIILKEKFKAKK